MNAFVAEHIRLYQNQFYQAETDPSGKSDCQELADRIQLVKKADISYFSDCRKLDGLPSNYLKYHAMSLGFFMLSCCPVLCYMYLYIFQPIEMEVNLFVFNIGIYFISLAFLVFRFFFEKMDSKIEFIFYLPLWMLCVAGSLLQIRIFGTTLGWFAVYIIGGAAVTLLIRRHHERILRKREQKLKEIADSAKTKDEMVRKTVELYNRIQKPGQDALNDFEKEHQLFAVHKPQDMCWLTCPRGTYGEYFDAHCDVLTDFCEPFRNSLDMEEQNQGKTKIFTSINVNSQEFRWSEISAMEAERLLRDSHIYPFFNLGLPYFREEWKYKLFRHSWNITKSIEEYYEYKEKESFISDAQAKFDLYTTTSETLLLGWNAVVEDLQYDSDYFLSEKAKQYVEMKKMAREELGATVIEHQKIAKNKKTEELTGDEIGTLLVYDENKGLIGAYAGDSRQSLAFTREHVGRCFRMSPLLPAYNGSQRMYLLEHYLK